MVEVGEETWGSAWPTMYQALGGNPWAAMPSLHFATSRSAAISLGEAGRAPGAVGWAYALTLGFALVYLGEHYVTDLAGGRGAGQRRAARRAAGRASVLGVNRGAAAHGADRHRVGSQACLQERARRERQRRRRAADCSPRRRVIQTLVVVVALLVGIYFLFPKLVGLGDALGKLDDADPVWIAIAIGFNVVAYRDLHRPLQGGGRRRRAAPDLGRDLRDQHGRGRRDAALLGGGGGRHRAHLLGAAQGGDARATTWRAAWSPSSPCTTPSTRSR